MWAVVDGDTVVGVYPPGSDLVKMRAETEGLLLVEMTVDNSPAWLFGKYVNGKFYPAGDSDA